MILSAKWLSTLPVGHLTRLPEVRSLRQSQQLQDGARVPVRNVVPRARPLECRAAGRGVRGRDRRVSGRNRRVGDWLAVGEGPMNKFGAAMICLAILLAGCGGSVRGDASAGPNPGGGFYGAPNINVGRINP
jgi:hypothetical protein